MATAVASLPFVSVDQYLHSTYAPDVDYVDGQLQERNSGEFDHGDLQGELITLFRVSSEAWGIRAVPETRVQVSPTRFLVPDICVMPLQWKRTPIIREAPLLCMEVLSPEDRMSRVRRRCEDFLQMGVAELWIFDPELRIAYVLSAAGLVEHKSQNAKPPGNTHPLGSADLFRVLDR